jgi:hypothetical protein
VTGGRSFRNTVGLRGQRGSLRLGFSLFQFFLGRRSLLVTIIVVVITRPASNFSRFSIDERHNGMVGYAATLDAMIVDDIA